MTDETDELVRSTLAVPEPDQEVIDRSGHRLRNRITNGPPTARVRVGWRIAGAGVAAGAAAAVVVIAVVPAQSPPSGPPAASGSGSTSLPATGRLMPTTVPVTGQETPVSGPAVLLAAATAAARAPATSGRYWHVRVSSVVDPPYDVWVDKDGLTWFRDVKTEGRVMVGGRSRVFRLGLVTLDYDRLRALPTEPAALRAVLVDALADSDARTGAGPLTDADRADGLYLALSSLLSTVPAEPGTRAAAFRLLAELPGVRTLGPVPGGQGLLLPGDYRLVVDPATGRVHGTSFIVTFDGAATSAGEGDTFSVTCEWVDALPS
ncbi:CU044_5270 family protein [Actinokineospora enzanensis]|uniref:CU044_5270 family protein n=1 Tax=Actinokineospora enzanensis TaxID=155975 RepID=UPI00038189F7|nr:CU044_5270 family protein [Actinokineospora enzanensis]